MKNEMYDEGDQQATRITNGVDYYSILFCFSSFSSLLCFVLIE